MVVDHFFTIGQRHAREGSPCGDYAWSALLRDGSAAGAIADGCSGANANTDIGARALVHAFFQALPAEAPAGGWFGKPFLANLRRAFRANRITLDSCDYLATLVGFVASPARVSAFMFGDGAVLLRRRDRQAVLVEIEWRDNAPCYLAYVENDERRDRFFASLPPTPIRRKETRLALPGGVDSGVALLGSTNVDLDFAALENGLVLDFDVEAEQLDCVAVLSDGISSFAARQGYEVAGEFLDFRCARGSFVKRRLLRALAGLDREGHRPSDDLAMAAVWLGDVDAGR